MLLISLFEGHEYIAKAVGKMRKSCYTLYVWNRGLKFSVLLNPVLLAVYLQQ